MKLSGLPTSKRPREKLMDYGVENLKNHELLAILLRTGLKNKNVLELAQEILKKYPIETLSEITLEDFKQIKGVENSKACTILASIELAKRSLSKKLKSNKIFINSPADVLAQLRDFPKYQKEHFAVLYLNARSELIHSEILSIGILNASLINAREVFEPAIRYHSAYIILAHNHPSGSLEASSEDILNTKKIQKAGQLLGIEVLDHIIISKEGYMSMSENQLIAF